ncbi:hypothetical protein ACIQNU_32110 [Streptomyces sp. NPDC091292]|uniref:hypothetical protein n=1 Tax=Streptomyces sp. NPDC091292 TaxID=3365991 RepID=UPI0037F91FB2
MTNAPGSRRTLTRIPAARTAALTLAAAAAALGAGSLPAQAADGLVVLTLVDNSNADSWLEVDRTLNTNHGPGTSGSDHDGSAVDLMDTLINPDRPGEEQDQS